MRGGKIAAPVPNRDGFHGKPVKGGAMRKIYAALSAATVALVAALPAAAATLTVTPPVDISLPTAFAPGCGGPTEGSFPGTNFNYPNSEAEPWLAVSPTNPNDVAAFWQ